MADHPIYTVLVAGALAGAFGYLGWIAWQAHKKDQHD